MRSLGWIGFAALALLAGCNLLKKDDGDAGATASTASTGLPPECETFLTRYSCLLTKDGKPTTEADDMRRDWTKVVATPAVRPGITDVCKKQLETQGAAFDKAGCTSSTAVVAATATATATVVKAAATNAPAAPKCKGTNDCPKGKECVGWIDGNTCVVTCMGNTCPAGEVCEATVRRLDGSGVTGVCAKAPHNVAFGGACKTSLDCVASEKCIKGPDGTFCRQFCDSRGCKASDQQCSSDEGNEMPDMGHEGKNFCIRKKGGAAAPSAAPSTAPAAVTTCPKGQIWHEGMKTCGTRCAEKPELGPGCPKGFYCSLTSNIDGVCIKQ